MTDKFFEVARLVWNQQKAKCIFDGVMSIGNIDDVHAFFAKYPI